MKNNFIAKSSVTINAPAGEVWNSLIDPAMIKQYLFGTEALSDWKEGSPIIYKGVWNGKPYEDKGIVLKVVPQKLLESTYWSSMSGLADIAENYNKVTYELSSNGSQTTLSVSQDNNTTEQSRDHSQKNWDMVLKSIKDLLEK